MRIYSLGWECKLEGVLGELKTILLIRFIGRISGRWINVLDDITRITCIVRLAAKATIKWE